MLGTVPQSNSSSLPPTVSFILDAEDPFVVTQPLASHAFFNQPLFSTAQLNNTPHQLVINVTSAGSPFTVDYFVVFPPDIHDVISSTSQVSPTDASANTSLNGGAFDASALLTIKLLAVFLGIMVLILLLIIGFFIFRTRKNSSRRRKPSLPGNPMTSESKRGRASAGHGMCYLLANPGHFSLTEAFSQWRPCSRPQIQYYEIITVSCGLNGRGVRALDLNTFRRLHLPFRQAGKNPLYFPSFDVLNICCSSVSICTLYRFEGQCIISATITGQHWKLIQHVPSY